MKLARMRMKPPNSYSKHNDETFNLTHHLTLTEEEARDQIFHGSAEALKAAEAEVWRLGKLWLAYLRDEGFGVPASCRLDFMVVASKAANGPSEVWTVELCECGGALCGYTHHARTAAILNACCSAIEDDTASKARQPVPDLVAEQHESSSSGDRSNWRYDRGAVQSYNSNRQRPARAANANDGV